MRGFPTRASDEASEWSPHRFSGSSSPLSAADKLNENIKERMEDVDEQLESGWEFDERGHVESCEYVGNDKGEDFEDFEEEEEEEFTVMGRHGALISLVWGATALYVLLIRTKVQQIEI